MIESPPLSRHTRRREFIALMASVTAIAWPRVPLSQQGTAPIIGFLSSRSELGAAERLASFRRGLKEVGFLEGQNVAIEFRWANGQYDQLSTMAADLVRHAVLIVAQGPPAALAARASTTNIPIVFVVGFDPVVGGLVSSLSQPGGNASGITLMTAPLGQKRLELVREIAPKAATVGLLTNPISPDAAPEMQDIQAAAHALRLELKEFNASNPIEIEAAFAAIARQVPDALLIGSDPFFMDQCDKIVGLTAKLRVPAIYPFREFAIRGTHQLRNQYF
jgi:ABC-type uncharacterized transport system substrate-binding protein